MGTTAIRVSNFRKERTGNSTVTPIHHDNLFYSDFLTLNTCAYVRFVLFQLFHNVCIDLHHFILFYSHKKPGESEYSEVRRELPVSHLRIGIFVYHASLFLNCQSEIHSPSLSFFYLFFYYSTAFFKSMCVILLICGHFYRPTFFSSTLLAKSLLISHFTQIISLLQLLQGVEMKIED